MDRDQIEARYQWDLSCIFADDEAWEKAFEGVSRMPDFSAYRGTLRSKENILAFLRAQEGYEEALMRTYLYAFLRGVVDGVYNGGFEPAERKIERRALHARVRKRKGVFISLRAYLIYADAARIGQTHCAASLVERFTFGVVPCFSYHFIISISVYGNYMRMAAADHKAEKRRLKL